MNWKTMVRAALILAVAAVGGLIVYYVTSEPVVAVAVAAVGIWAAWRGAVTGYWPGPITRWIAYGALALLVYRYAVVALLDRAGFVIGPLAGFVIISLIAAAAGFMAARQVGTARSGAITGLGAFFAYVVILIVSAKVDDPGLPMAELLLIGLLPTATGALAGAVGGWVAVRTRPPAAQGGKTLIDAARVQEGQRVRIGYRDESSQTDVRGQVLRVGPDDVVIQADESGREVLIPIDKIAVVEPLEPYIMFR
jgi:hypothetical protein